MFTSATASTRRAKSSHEPWVPHQYQERAVEFLLQQNAAALFLDPGLGKTSITLAAFDSLRNASQAQKMLVVAPLRALQTTWLNEAKKWTQFRHLRLSVLHGPNKKQRLKDDADIWLINPEGCQWLATEFFGRSLPWDTVVIDELTKFKNHRSVRSKSLRPRLKSVRRCWGLTGTPIPNGYLDLFGQFLMLDDGAALGKYVTHYRDNYFQPDFNGFDYVLQPGAAARIEARIAPYVLRMSAEDYLDLPPLVDDIRYVELEPGARALYEQMKKQMLAELPEGVVTGANAAAVYSKLKQMANGACYLSGVQSNEKRSVAHLHDTKIDALEELVEELCGQPLLCAYEFNHDLERLLQRFPGTPYIGAGVSAKKLQEIVDEWNAGNTRILFAHPASAGHGLNLQGSGAAHIAWFGPIWDLELYEQFIQRVHRQGTTAKRVVNHIFMARATIDELVMDAVRDKAVTQERLLANLTTELSANAEDPRSGETATKESKMEVRKLSRQGNGSAPPPAVASGPLAPRIVPKGWGAPTPNVAAEGQRVTENYAAANRSFGQPHAGHTTEIEQRAAITRGLSPEPPPIVEEVPASVRAKEMFSQGVRQQLQAPAGEAGHMAQEVDNLADAHISDVNYGVAPKRPRKKADREEIGSLTIPTDYLRQRALELAITAAGTKGFGSIDDLLAAAKEIYGFLIA